MIKSYYDFLLESILFVSDELEDILLSLDDKVANEFIGLINQDIETQYNGLNLTKSNDKVSFLTDRQFQNKIKKGSGVLDLIKIDTNQTSVGRIVRQILKDNKKEFSDSDIEKFVDKFKAAWTTRKLKQEEKSPLRLVSGEEIKFWYSRTNYCEETSKGKGTLGKSCMRYSECQDYFSIYTQNPEVCKMLILTETTNSEEFLRARALVWTTDKGIYLDRIYYTDSSEIEILKNYAKENLNCQIFHDSNVSVPRIQVNLTSPTDMYQSYPYMDTLCYYYTIKKTLFNYEVEVDSPEDLLYIQDTEGGYERQDTLYSEYLDEPLPRNSAIWSDYHQSYLPDHRVRWSEEFSSEIFDDESVYSDTLGDWLPREESSLVVIDKDGETDWFPDNSEDFKYDKKTNKYYLKTLMIQDENGDWSLKEE